MCVFFSLYLFIAASFDSVKEGRLRYVMATPLTEKKKRIPYFFFFSEDIFGKKNEPPKKASGLDILVIRLINL